jgi:L-2-hydroxyglutarate oxidase LhgO
MVQHKGIVAERVECVVIGAGVVGLATARALAQQGREVFVLEAERAIGTATSSRSSEVIHAGIYYPAGSLKARLCVEGRQRLYRYCEQRQVAHRRIGKLIVATSEHELPVLERYRRLAIANGVLDLEPLNAAQVRGLEPQVRCVAGLLSPSTGIIDSHGLMQALQADLEAHGGTLVLGAPVRAGALGRSGIRLEVGGAAPTTVHANWLVNAAGLGAQQVSHALAGLAPEAVPRRYLAKAHYFALMGRSPFRRLVYPVANSAGLGTHVTLDLAGNARFGPDVSWVEEVDYGFDERRRAQFADAIRLYYPELEESRLRPAYTGIRPKLSGPDEPAADFCIRGPEHHDGCPYLALYGIESPGLTAALAIAAHVLPLLR